MYAVNIADCTAHAQNPDDQIPLMIVTSNIDKDPTHAIECERGKIAGWGALFLCGEKQANAIIQVIRKKYKKHEWRFYHKTNKGWKRV